MKVVMYDTPSASKYWRLVDPAKYLNLTNRFEVVVADAITEESILWGDIFVLHNCIDKEGIAMLRAYQQERGKKIVVDVDDYLVLDDSNPNKKLHDITNASEIIKITIGIADLVTTTNKYLASLLKRNINPKKIAILPNYMDLERWDLPKLKNTSDKIRIGWLGSITHKADLEMIVEPLRRICSEFPDVEVVTVGDMRTRTIFDGLPLDARLGVPFDSYPALLNGLRLDIGLAPLVDTTFNRAKSPIKFYEYSIAQVAGIYSPTVYQHKGFEPNYGMVAYDSDQWYQGIKTLIEHPDYRNDLASNAYRWVKQKKDLKKHIKEWETAYFDLK